MENDNKQADQFSEALYTLASLSPIVEAVYIAGQRATREKKPLKEILQQELDIKLVEIKQEIEGLSK